MMKSEETNPSPSDQNIKIPNNLKINIAHPPQILKQQVNLNLSQQKDHMEENRSNMNIKQQIQRCRSSSEFDSQYHKIYEKIMQCQSNEDIAIDPSRQIQNMAPSYESIDSLARKQKSVSPDMCMSRSLPKNSPIEQPNKDPRDNNFRQYPRVVESQHVNNSFDIEQKSLGISKNSFEKYSPESNSFSDYFSKQKSLQISRDSDSSRVKILQSLIPISMTSPSDYKDFQHSSTANENHNQKSYVLSLLSSRGTLSRIDQVSEISEINSSKVSMDKSSASRSGAPNSYYLDFYQQEMAKLVQYYEKEIASIRTEAGIEIRQLITDNQQKMLMLAQLGSQVNYLTHLNENNARSGQQSPIRYYEDSVKNEQLQIKKTTEKLNKTGDSAIQNQSQQRYEDNESNQGVLELSDNSLSTLKSKVYENYSKSKNQETNSHLPDSRESKQHDILLHQLSDLKEYCVNLEIQNCKLLKINSDFQESQYNLDSQLLMKRKSLVETLNDITENLTSDCENQTLRNSKNNDLKSLYRQLDETLVINKALKQRNQKVEHQNSSFKKEIQFFFKDQQITKRLEKQVSSLIRIKAMLEYKIKEKITETHQLKQQIQQKDKESASKMQKLRIQLQTSKQQQLKSVKQNHEKMINDCIAVFRQNETRFTQEKDCIADEMNLLRENLIYLIKKETQLLQVIKERDETINSLSKKLQMPKFLREKTQRKQLHNSPSVFFSSKASINRSNQILSHQINRNSSVSLGAFLQPLKHPEPTITMEKQNHNHNQNPNVQFFMPSTNGFLSRNLVHTNHDPRPIQISQENRFPVHNFVTDHYKVQRNKSISSISFNKSRLDLNIRSRNCLNGPNSDRIIIKYN